MVNLQHRRKSFRFSTAEPSELDNVVLLLSCNGLNGGTSFSDSSLLANTVTVGGGAQTSTAQSKFNGSSAFFDGSGDYLTIPDSASWDFDTGDLTIEMWVRMNGVEPSATRAIISSGAVGSVASFWTLEGTAAGKFAFYNSAYSDFTPLLLSTTTSWSNTWRFIQIVRSGNDWSMNVDGVTESSITNSSACNSNGQLVIGAGWYDLAARGVSAYLAEIRISKGLARDNIVPTQPFPPDFYFSNNVLLLHCDGLNGSTTFTDSSSYAHTMSVAGNVQVTTSGPKFGSGAALFDGSGDQIYHGDSVDWNFSTNDWTIEGWVYPDSASAAQTIIGQWSYPASRAFFFGVGTGYGVYLNNALIVGYSAWPSASTWHHWAITREGVNVRLFVNGTQQGSTVNIGTGAIFDSDANLGIGRDDGGNPYFAGKMDEIRITNGVARYTADFTPPTAAFPNF